MKLRHAAAFALGEKAMDKKCVMCGASKDEAKFPDIAAGEVGEAQSPLGQIQFRISGVYKFANIAGEASDLEPTHYFKLEHSPTT
jgi:hypothetical protein